VSALFRLALALAAPVPWLNPAARRDSPVHSSIGTPSDRPHAHARPGHGPLTAWGYAVSVVSFTPLPGCFSPFPRGTLRYRSTQVFSLGEWSPPLPTDNRVFRGTRAPQPPSPHAFDHGTLTLSGRPFQALRLACLCPARTRQSPPLTPHYPAPATPAGFMRGTGLGSSAFARHYSRNPFFSSGYLDVSVPPLTSPTLCVQPGVPRHDAW